jgi:hypothetical protein
VVFVCVTMVISFSWLVFVAVSMAISCWRGANRCASRSMRVVIHARYLRLDLTSTRPNL